MNLRQVGPHELGRLGEHFAAEHLRRDRMQILARNWRHHRGEIDLIARQADVIVFCEVKTRRSRRYGALDAVDGEKLQRVTWLARAWLNDHCRPDQPWRIDRVALTVTDAHHIGLEHHWGNRHGLQSRQHGLHDRHHRHRRHRRGLGLQIGLEDGGGGAHVGPA